MQRFPYLPAHTVTAVSDDAVIAIAGAAVKAEDLMHNLTAVTQ